MKVSGSRILLLFALMWVFVTSVFAAEAPFSDKLDWKFGPAKVALKNDMASFEIPQEYAYLNEEETQRLMDAMEQKTGTEIGMVTPAIKEPDWFVVFEYDKTGYVKDDDADKIDSDELIKQMKEATEEHNKETPDHIIHVVGWQEKPHYNKETHNLEWAVLVANDKGHESVNYSVRLLGREGVTSITLVAAKERLEALKPELSRIIDNYQYNQGKRYMDFDAKTDKVAEYGLTGLVAGGLGLAAVKTGFFAKFIVPILLVLKKGIVFIFIGIAALFGKIKAMLFGGGSADEEK